MRESRCNCNIIKTAWTLHVETYPLVIALKSTLYSVCNVLIIVRWISTFVSGVGRCLRIGGAMAEQHLRIFLHYFAVTSKCNSLRDHC